MICRTWIFSFNFFSPTISFTFISISLFFFFINFFNYINSITLAFGKGEKRMEVEDPWLSFAKRCNSLLLQFPIFYYYSLQFPTFVATISQKKQKFATFSLKKNRKVNIKNLLKEDLKEKREISMLYTPSHWFILYLKSLTLCSISMFNPPCHFVVITVTH